MKFFLDTADLDQIKKYAAMGLIDGVTTNPSLIAKEKVNFKKRIQDICTYVDGPVSAEVVSTEHREMLVEARKLAKWHENVIIKVPMTEDGLETVRVLRKEGIDTNVTLIFSASQALLAAKAGATFVSPFIGRLDDISEDGMQLISDILDIFDAYAFDTEIIVASIRHPRHVVEAAKMGAHVATIPPAVMDQLFKHPLTDKGIEKFLADWELVKNL